MEFWREMFWLVVVAGIVSGVIIVAVNLLAILFT